jgi:hypothetical protein
MTKNCDTHVDRSADGNCEHRRTSREAEASGSERDKIPQRGSIQRNDFSALQTTSFCHPVGEINEEKLADVFIKCVSFSLSTRNDGDSRRETHLGFSALHEISNVRRDPRLITPHVPSLHNVNLKS